MNSILFHVSPSFAHATVPPQLLSPVKLAQLTMDPDKEDVEARQELGELSSPGSELDDVLHNQVVTRGGEGWQATMEPSEEPGPHLIPPGECAFRIPSLREKPGGKEPVAGNVKER